MNKVLVALNIFVLSVVLVLASGTRSSWKQVGPIWDVQSVRYVEADPAIDLANMDAEQIAQLKESTGKLAEAQGKAVKESDAQQKALLDQGYEPFAVVKDHFEVVKGNPMIETIMYFKKAQH